MDFDNNLENLDINLEELPIFANYKTDKVYKYLKVDNKINTLNELFSLSDSNGINLFNSRESIRQRVYGIIDLLKYEYYETPLNFQEYYDMNLIIYNFWREKIFNTDNQEIPLARMGFDKSEIRYLYDLIESSNKKIRFIDLLFLANKKVKDKIRTIKHVDAVRFYLSFISKVQILISFYEKTNRIESYEDSNKQKINSLHEELVYLKEEKRKIEERIDKINEELIELKSAKSK